MLQYNPTVSGSSTVSGSIYVNSPNQTMGQFVGNQNGYVEFSIRNTNTGASASGDIAVYADNGTTLNNYIDMGINNSGLSPTYYYGGTDFGDALDAYLYNVGGNLRIGNATSTSPYSQSFYLFSNATATPNIAITGSQVAINKSSSLNGTLDVNGDTIVTGSLKVSAGITGSFAGTASYAAQALTASNATTAITANTASYVVTAQTASYVLNAVSSSFATTANTASYANSFTVGGTLTAQTIVVQTISSSVEYASGSNRFGQNTGNTHQFTGSVLVTGSQTINGNVSVGNTNNTYKLDVSGQSVVRASNTNGIALQAVATDGNSTIYLRPNNSGYNLISSNYLSTSPYLPLALSARENSADLVLATNGNIGIGTSSPVSLLDVYNQTVATYGILSLRGTSRGGEIDFYDGATVGASIVGGTSSDKSLYFYASGSSSVKMTIKDSGNVLVGTSTDGGNRLEVVGTANNWGVSVSANTTASQSYGAIIRGGTNASDIAFRVNNAANNTSYFTVRGDGAATFTGNVGIGTTSPSYNLSVASYLGVGAQGGGDIVLIGGGSGVGAFIQLRYADGTVNTSLAGNNNSYLNANYGNTGIGTTNPANKLSVLGEIAKYCTTAGVDGSFQNLIKYGYGPDLTSGNATANRWLGIDASVTAGSAAANILRIRAYGGGTGNGAPVNVVDFKGDQTSAFYGSIAVTGAITATGDVTAYSSDKRLKENITNIPSALDKILSLNGVTYDWNKKALDFGFVPDRLKHDVGLLAQEVQSVLPEAIAPAPFDTDTTTGESISGENYLTVRYEKLVALLVEGIKEQQNQIDELKALINK